MLNGRAKSGPLQIDWTQVALARPYQRRTIRLRPSPAALAAKSRADAQARSIPAEGLSASEATDATHPATQLGSQPTVPDSATASDVGRTQRLRASSAEASEALEGRTHNRSEQDHAVSADAIGQTLDVIEEELRTLRYLEQALPSIPSKVPDLLLGQAATHRRMQAAFQAKVKQLAQPPAVAATDVLPGAANLSLRTQTHLRFHIREMTVAAGGLGCALWDGSVVLARWLAASPEILVGQTVLELGAGCGLPGIVAARFAHAVTLTEYIPDLVKNLTYNININSIADGDQASDDDDDDERSDSAVNPGGAGATAMGMQHGVDTMVLPWHRDLRTVATAKFLDWFQVPDRRTRQPSINGSEPSENPVAVCSRVDHGRSYVVQAWRPCATCFPSDPDCGVCLACAAICHVGHDLGPEQTTRFRCDCADLEPAPVKAASSAPAAWGGCRVAEPSLSARHAEAAAVIASIPQVDIIVGAELTYNTLSIEALANVVDYYLKPDGVFYETLSDDRDGALAFVDEMRSRGFDVARHPADRGFMGSYNTRDWTFQNTESYSFYTFSRPQSTHPVMGSRGPLARDATTAATI